MVTTTDPPEAIRQTLYTNWKLHGNLSKERLGESFSTGVIAGSRKYPSIEVLPFTTPTKILTLEWHMLDPLVHVHVWTRPRTTSKEDLTTAKNIRKYLVQEVRRIMHEQQLHVQDCDWVYPDGTEINPDQYYAVEEDVVRGERSSAPATKGAFPILHTIMPYRAKQFHNAITGGIAVSH